MHARTGVPSRSRARPNHRCSTATNLESWPKPLVVFSTVSRPENGHGRVTIADVAGAAGVSVPTVSKVINGRADVAPATRARVERLLREHGYRRRPPARDRRAGLVDAVFNELESPWAIELIRGVEEVAREHEL